MQITFQHERAERAAAELLALSRSVRRADDEIGDILRELRSQSVFDTQRQELKRESEAIWILTARLVDLSTALSTIVELYGRAEDRNAADLEGGGAWRPPTHGRLYRVGGDARARAGQLLRR